MIALLLLGLSTFKSVPAASLLEAACTSCTRTGTNAGSNAGAGLEINVGAGLETNAGAGSGTNAGATPGSIAGTGLKSGPTAVAGSVVKLFKFRCTFLGRGGGVRCLVARDPLGDLEAGVEGAALLLLLDRESDVGKDEDDGGLF